MQEALKGFLENETIKDLRIFVIGRNERLAGAVRRAGNRNPLSLNMLHKDLKFEELKHLGKETLYFYDAEDYADEHGLIKLLKENKPDLDISTAKVVVLGYGNVARGAMHEIYDQGFKNIHVLGRTQTTKDRIDEFL